jgi:hypothetical protein
MPLLIDVTARAALISKEFDEDVDEALARFEDAGGQDGGEEAVTWVSVAFLFGRSLRDRCAAAFR